MNPTDSSRSEPRNARAKDRDVEPERNTAAHERWGTVFVVCALIVAVVSGVAFIYVYWTNGSNALLGGFLAIFLGAIGASFVLYSHWLMPKREAVEPREQLASPLTERDQAYTEFCAGCQEIRRRGLFVTIGAGAATFIVAAVVSFFSSLGAPPGRSLYDRIWKRGQRLTKMDGTHVSIDTLVPGSFVVVFPEDSIGDVRAQTMLVRVNPNLLDLPDGRSNWAPMGYVAYSRVCTHAGCPVGLFETTTNLLMCPCHQSTFNVLRGARPTGGPAVRSLPQLPLYADADGTLRAGGPFTEPPGPGFWWMP